MEGFWPTAGTWSARTLAQTNTGKTNLNLQDVVPAETLVMHLVISIVCIAPVLVFDEGEATILLAETTRRRRRMGYSQTARRRARGRNVTADKATIAVKTPS